MFEHPKNVCMTYLQHACFSLEMSLFFLLGSITGIGHAIYPDIFVTSTTDTVNYIQKRLNESGCRKEKEEKQDEKSQEFKDWYQEVMESEGEEEEVQSPEVVEI